MADDRTDEALTYGIYLRVPELLSLQTPLAEQPVHDEMLFIIGQQAQELWFKQILFDLKVVLADIDAGRLANATRLLSRSTGILRLLGNETEVLESLEPIQFHRFRGYLKAASGFESEQFRELEIASGLRDEGYLKMAAKMVDLQSIRARWPRNLHDAMLGALTSLGHDPTDALARLYAAPDEHPQLYSLMEGLSQYEVRFQEWRFHHMQVVERVIGDRSPGTGGSAGSSYLMRTLAYRFFPELWEARNRLVTGKVPAL